MDTLDLAILPTVGPTLLAEYELAKRQYHFVTHQWIESGESSVMAEVRYNYREGIPATRFQPAATPEIDYRVFEVKDGKPVVEFNMAEMPEASRNLDMAIAKLHG